MLSKDSDYKTWVKSIIGLYVLTLLKKEPIHGNKLAEKIRNRTKSAISPNPNALYPLLRIMEEHGYIAGNWSNPETRNKRVYSITELGLSFLPALQEKVRIKLDESECKLQILREDLLHN
ncbi:PadR family transcriptional regulator [Sporomusa sp.]|jgi:DNA-binding PadR family transcriptional regulator|uniref:PadR family transcriptional regulator n=1 Tax=Sporomusa sp. TaxID=2078658 RepID=UPI002C2BC7CB|nr:PadR family transcriptional regulator [Sporomusa sp.]MDF2873974.1 transcriptional regulator, PadR-like family [Sporomusa sp.]HWR08157.1 PadR family transcriptional regulator [Sporomusa sp.]